MIESSPSEIAAWYVTLSVNVDIPIHILISRLTISEGRISRMMKEKIIIWSCPSCCAYKKKGALAASCFLGRHIIYDFEMISIVFLAVFLDAPGY
jgi:hypothetical protein